MASFQPLGPVSQVPHRPSQLPGEAEPWGRSRLKVTPEGVEQSLQLPQPAPGGPEAGRVRSAACGGLMARPSEGHGCALTTAPSGPICSEITRKNPTAKAISEVILEQAAWPRALVAGSSARPSLGIALVSDSSLGRGEHPGIWGAPLGTPQPS